MAEGGFSTFFHINEFGSDGWKQLPALCALSKEVTLWAPSGVMLKKAYEAGESRLSPKDVLTLVREGNVKIAGREKWLFNRRGRQNLGPQDYPGAAWLDCFDDEIAALADQGKISTKSCVQISGEERGHAWAETVFKNDKSVFKQAEALLVPELHDALPLGTRERVTRIQQSDRPDKHNDSVKVILRDSLNHADAKKFCGANISIEKGRESIIKFLELGNNDPLTMPLTDKPITLDAIDDAINILTEISQCSDVNALIKVIQDTRSAQQLYDIVSAEESANYRIANQIKSGIQNDSISSFFGVYSDYQILGIASIIVSAYSWYLGGKDGINAAKKILAEPTKVSRREMLKAAVTIGGTFISVAGAGIAPAVWAMERFSVTGDKHFYSGPSYPFLLAYNTDNPTRQQIDDLMQNLMSMDIDNNNLP